MNNLPQVEVRFSQIVTDLNEGMTWLSKEDNGMGSIQDKYDATEMQISVLRQHPVLKDIEPPRVKFKFIDDITNPVVEEEDEKETELVNTKTELVDEEIVSKL